MVFLNWWRRQSIQVPRCSATALTRRFARTNCLRYKITLMKISPPRHVAVRVAGDRSSAPEWCMAMCSGTKYCTTKYCSLVKHIHPRSPYYTDSSDCFLGVSHPCCAPARQTSPAGRSVVTTKEPITHLWAHNADVIKVNRHFRRRNCAEAWNNKSEARLQGDMSANWPRLAFCRGVDCGSITAQHAGMRGGRRERGQWRRSSARCRLMRWECFLARGGRPGKRRRYSLLSTWCLEAERVEKQVYNLRHSS